MANTYEQKITPTVTYVAGIGFLANDAPNNGLTPVNTPPPAPAAPTLNADISKDLPAPKTAQVFTINVVDKYDWTASKNKQDIAARLFGDKIPYVELTEMRLLGGNMIYSILQAILNIGDIGQLYKSALTENPALAAIGNAIVQASSDGAIQAALGKVNTVKSALTTADNATGNIVSNTASGIGSGIGSVIGTAADYTVKPIAGFVTNYGEQFLTAADRLRNKFLSSIPSNLRKDLINASAITPYENLYLTELTNVKYKMPYFDTKYMEVKNSFSDSYSASRKLLGNANAGEEGLIDKTIGMIDSALDRIISVAGMLEPGVYIERPKFYNFDSNNTPEITVRFPLLNTLNAASIQQNVELIHQLALQNKPYRKSRVLTEQPVIYQVTIPGQAYYPYAYIASMNVEFLGTKRIRKVKISGTAVDMTIPDAYEVTIVLRGLNSDTGNFIVAEMGNNKVNVSTRKVSQ